MGKQNNVLYSYLSAPERFAEIFNLGLFQGNQVLKAEQLEAAGERSIQKEDGEYRETNRDIRKVLRDGSVYQIFAVENQSYVSFVMPLRCMMYDAREYQSQIEALEKENRKQKKLKNSDEYLSGLQKRDRIAPVYTIVVYWGEKEWNGPRCLKDMMEFAGNEQLKELFCDYSMHLLCINEIENCEDYKSDLKEVIRLLKCRGDKEKMYAAVSNCEEYRHLSEETYDVLSVLLGDDRLPVKKEAAGVKGEGGYDMCKALTELYEDGIKEGRKEGLKEGELRFSRLCEILIHAGKESELKRIVKDPSYREQLYQEYGLC